MEIKNLLQENEIKVIHGYIYIDYNCTTSGEIIITDKKVMTQSEDSICVIKLSEVVCIRYGTTDKNCTIVIKSCTDDIHIYFPKNAEWRAWSEKVFTALNKYIT